MATKKVGWVKQHRSITDTVIYEWSGARFKIFHNIVSSANWKANKWPFRGREYDLQPGQLVTSYSSIAKACKSKDITYNLVRTTCQKLVEHGYIEMETIYRTSIIITVLGWREQYGGVTENITEGVTEISEGGNPENVDIAGLLTGGEGENVAGGSQNGSQKISTIEEVRSLKNIKEKGSIPKMPPPSSAHVKILNNYYQSYHKHTGKRKHRDINYLSKTLDKYEITNNDSDTVIAMLSKWFEHADQGTKGKLYPLPFFCQQYDEICNKEVEVKEEDKFKYMANDCKICGQQLFRNSKGEVSPHRCKHTGYCDKCNTAWWWYEGEPEPDHNCERYQERVKQERQDDYL